LKKPDLEKIKKAPAELDKILKPVLIS